MRRFFGLQNFHGGSRLAGERIAGIMYLLKGTSLLRLFLTQMFIALLDTQASILRRYATGRGTGQSITSARGGIAVNGFHIVLR